MFNHDEILPLLAAYHDGQLGAKDVQGIEAHLLACTDCRRKLEDWRALDLAILNLPEPEWVGDEMLDQVLDRIQSAEAGVFPQTARVVPIYRKRWALAAAAVLVIAGGALLWHQMQAPAPFVQDAPVAEPVAEPVVAPAMRVSTETDSLPGNREETPAVGGEIEQTAIKPPQLAQIEPTVPAPVGAGDTGIPQMPDWPARLLDTLEAEVHYRFPAQRPPRLVELNLLHEFEIEFVGIGYAIGDLLNQGHDARLTEPTMLRPDEAYLVSNLRMERTALLARVSNQVLSAEVALRLAEVTWRLANITADYDDVKHAMVAQADAMRHRPDLSSRSRSRIVQLQAMIN